jgi:antitoxin ParD1/3/4
MNVSLTAHLDKFVKSKVKSGSYNSASEVVRESLRLLEQRDQLQQTKMEALRHDIKIGISQMERGLGVELDSKGMKSLIKDIKDIKAQGRSKISKRKIK